MNLFYNRFNFIILLTVLISSFGDLRAQVTLVAPQKMAAKGSFLSAEVRIKSTDSVTSLQMSFAWDTSVLKIVSITDNTLPNVLSEPFGINDTSRGVLTYVWLDPSSTLSGVLFRDTFLLFRVNFRVVGRGGSSSALEFRDVPTPVKATDRATNFMTVNRLNGRVTVERGVSVVEEPASSSDFEMYKCYPNPFKDILTIPFELGKLSQIELSIFDISGVQMMVQKRHFNIGKHQFEVNTEGWKKGIYMVRMVLPSGVVRVQKVIKEE
jgi:hypothetical protein